MSKTDAQRSPWLNIAHVVCCSSQVQGVMTTDHGRNLFGSDSTLSRTFSNSQRKVMILIAHAGALLTPLSPKVGLIHDKLWLNSNRYSTFSNAIS